MEAVQTSDIDCTLCCEPMVPDDSIVVPCCQHRPHVSCLSRSLTSCGLRCPYCNQDLSEFAASSSFQAASVFHECMVDVSVPPSNRGINSMMLPAGFPAAPPVSFLCCHRRGPPPEFALLSDRRMERSPVRDPSSGAWAPQWICVQCSRTADSPILPGCSVSPCSQCAEVPHLVVDCAIDARWMWCFQCQRRQDFHPQSVTESTPDPNWFSHGPLANLGSLYGWGSPPVTQPGTGSQSWLFCPLISLGLLAAERTRGVPPYSTGSRVAVPDRQREFWVAHAGDIIQFYNEHLSSLSPQCDVALQSNWERGDHLPARVQELCTPAHIMAALHTWLSAQCDGFLNRGSAVLQPQTLMLQRQLQLRRIH